MLSGGVQPTNTSNPFFYPRIIDAVVPCYIFYKMAIKWNAPVLKSKAMKRKYLGIYCCCCLWLAICIEVAINRISPFFSNPAPPSLPPSHFGVSFFFFLFSLLPTILCQETVLFEISARLKLVSVQFNSLHSVVGHLEKGFPESIM